MFWESEHTPELKELVMDTSFQLVSSHNSSTSFIPQHSALLSIEDKKETQLFL